jgi:hypothetical protein
MAKYFAEIATCDHSTMCDPNSVRSVWWSMSDPICGPYPSAEASVQVVLPISKFPGHSETFCRNGHMPSRHNVSIKLGQIIVVEHV